MAFGDIFFGANRPQPFGGRAAISYPDDPEDVEPLITENDQEPADISSVAQITPPAPRPPAPAKSITPPPPLPAFPVATAPRSKAPSTPWSNIVRANPALLDHFGGQVEAERQQAATEQKQAEKNAQANEAAARRARNAQMAIASQTTGLRTARDEEGLLQPLTDDAGAPLYRPKQGQVQYDPQTGKPFQVNRDATGATAQVDPDADAPVGPNKDDPSDPQLYRQTKFQPWQPVGHVDELADDDRQPLEMRNAAKGWQAKRRKLIAQAGLHAASQTAVHAQTAHLGAQNHLATTQSQIQEAQKEIEELDADPAGKETQGGFLGIGSSPTEAATAIAARRAAAQKKIDDLSAHAAELQTQLPTLKTQASAAAADASITRHGLDLTNYTSLADQRRQLLAEQGKGEEGDPVLAAITKKQEELGVRLAQARDQKIALPAGEPTQAALQSTPDPLGQDPKVRELKSGQPEDTRAQTLVQQTPTPPQGQANSNALANAGREALGGASAGTLGIAEGAARFMQGQEAATPGSVNAYLDKQIADRQKALDTISKLPSYQQDPHVVQTITTEIKTLRAKREDSRLLSPGDAPGLSNRELLNPAGQTRRDARVAAASETADTAQAAKEEAGAFFGQDPARKDDKLARAARAAGETAPLIASTLAPGGLGMLAGAGVAALQSKGAAYDEAIEHARKSGMVDAHGDPTPEAKAQAQSYSDAAAIRSIPEMVAFLGTGKVAAGVISKLLSPSARPLTRFLVSSAVSTAGNAAAGSVNQAVEQVATGKPLDAGYSLERFVQDALFGAMHGGREAIQASREHARVADQFKVDNAALNAARERLGPVTAGAASAHLAIPHPPELDATTQAHADASVADSFAGRNPEAPKVAPEVVAKAREFAPPDADRTQPAALAALDQRIEQSESAVADAKSDADRAKAQGAAALAYAQKDAIVRQNDARLHAVQQISALPDWQPPVDPTTRQPTESPDPARDRERAGALLKLANGFTPDQLTAAEQARLKPSKGDAPLTRQAPDGSTILTDAGRRQLAAAAPAAAPFVQGSESDALRARVKPAEQPAEQGTPEPPPALPPPPKNEAAPSDPLAARIFTGLRQETIAKGEDFTPARAQKATQLATTAATHLNAGLQKFQRAFRSVGMDIVEDGPEKSGGVHSPGANEIRLSLADIIHPDNLRALQDPVRAHAAVQEEAIHAVAQHLEAKGEIDPVAVWKSLPPALQARVRSVYDHPAERNLGHEALRMIVQGRLNMTREGWAVDGKLLSEQTDLGLMAKSRQAVFKLLKFFKDLHGSMTRAGAKPEDVKMIQGAADRLEKAVRGVIDPSANPEQRGNSNALPAGNAQPGRVEPVEGGPGVLRPPAPPPVAGASDRQPRPPSDPPPTAGSGEPGEQRLPSEDERARAAAGLGVDMSQIGHVSTVTSSSGQQVRTAFVVREAADARPSHNPEGVPTPGYPQDFQPRDRSSASYRRQAQNIAGDLDLAKLADSPRPDEGSPIVTGSGHTLTGNGRDIAIGLAHRDRFPSAGRYKAALVQRAAELGLDPRVVLQMKQPVLHRVLLGHESPEALRRFSEDSNASPAMESNALEKAGQDAKRLTPALLSAFDPNYDLESPRNADFLKAFGQQVILGRSRPGEGNANELNLAPADLARRARLALFAAAYGGDEAGRSALERMGGDTEDRGRNISQSLLTLAPVMARLRADTASGDLHPGYDIAQPLVRAAQEISEAVANRPPKQSAAAAIDGLLAQQTFDHDPLERAALGFFARHRTNRAALEEGLSHYAEQVFGLGNPKHGPDMFGERRLPNPIELFLKAVSPTLASRRAENRAALGNDESVARLHRLTPSLKDALLAVSRRLAARHEPAPEDLRQAILALTGGERSAVVRMMTTPADAARFRAQLEALAQRYHLDLSPLDATARPNPSAVPAAAPVSFVDQVVQAAHSVPENQRFGAPKVPIALAFDAYRAQGGTLELPAFKSELIKAQTAGELTLSRADLAGAWDLATTQRSEAEYLGEKFHSVRTDSGTAMGSTPTGTSHEVAEEVRQSLLSRPASQIDEDGIHALAKPRGTAYLSDNEQRSDPAYILGSLVRPGNGTDAPERWKHGRPIARHARLLAWAQREGSFAQHPGDLPEVEPGGGGGEHRTFLDSASGRVFKLTKPGLYGAQGDDAGAYLQRWALHNRGFGDDARFEGLVHLPGENEARALVSQPFVPGRDSTAQEQADYLVSKGFHAMADGTWVHPVTGLKVWDTNTPGNAITTPEGKIQPIDLQIAPASANELAQARAESGLGRESLFARPAEPDPHVDPIDHLMALLDEGSRGEEIERLQQKSAGEAPGQRTIGRPDLAFGVASDAHRAVDQARADQHVAQSHADWNAEAARRYDADPQAEVRNLADKALRGDQLDAVETKIAQRAVADELARPDSPDQRRKVQAMIYGYRMTGTEQARAMAARFDPHQTPEQRHREFLGRMIYTPPREVEQQLQKLDPGDKAGRQRILDADQARVTRIEAELKKMGINFDDIFRGEIELRLKGAKIIDNTAQGLFDGARQRALKMLQGGARSFADVAKATGLAEAQVKQAYGQMRDALKAKLREKVRRGTTAENLDLKATLASKPAEGVSDPALKSDAETEAELERILHQMGFADPSKVGKMKVRAAKKTIFRPPPATADPAQWEAWKQGGVGDEVRRKIVVGQQEMQMYKPFNPGTGERIDPRFIRPSGDEQALLQLPGQDPTFNPGTGERAGAILIHDQPGAQARLDLPEAEYMRHVDLTDPGAVVRLARAIQSADSNGFDMAYEFWINNILSGPQTQVSNIVGNAGNAAWDFTVQRGTESLLNLIYRDSNSAQFGEFKYLLRGLGPGIQKGWRRGLEAFDAEHDMFESHALNQQPEFFGDSGALEGTRAAIPGKLGRTVRLPGRMLTFADSFFKHTLGQMEAGAQAYRIAKAEGLKGALMGKRVAQLVDTPGSEAWIRAVDKTLDLTFQTPLRSYADGGGVTEGATSAVMKMTRSRPTTLRGRIGQFMLSAFFPFIRTPYNIFKTGIRKSPLGSLNVLGNLIEGGLYQVRDGKPMLESYPAALQVKHLSEQLIAWSTMALIYNAVEGDGDDDRNKKFLITGSRPFRVDKTGQRELLERTSGGQMMVRLGASPNAVTVNYGRLEPFATVLGTMADAARSIKAGRAGASASDQLDKFYGYFLAQASGKTFLQGASDLLKSISGGGNVADQGKRAVLTALVPNLLRQPLRNLDDFARDGRDNAAYTALPLGGLAEKKLTPYGQPVEKSSHPLLRVIFPSGIKPSEHLEAADRLLMNWNARHPDEAWAPEPLSRKKPDRTTGKETDMSPAEYAQFQKRAAEHLRVKLAPVVNGRNAAHPTEADLIALKKAFLQAHHEAKRETFGDRTSPIPTRPLPRAPVRTGADVSALFGWK